MKKVILFIAAGLIFSASVFAGETPIYEFFFATACQGMKDGSISNSKEPIDPDSVFVQGEDFYLFGEFKNVVGKHRFMVEKFLNGISCGSDTTAWKNVQEKWPWDFSYFYHPISNPRPGNWEFIIYFGHRDGSFERVTEMNPRVRRTDPDYTFVRAVACLGIADGEIKNSKVPIGADSVFTAGDTVRGLLELIHVYVDHRFKVVTLYNDRFWSEYKSSWREVGYGWDYSHFIPELKNARAGDWEFWVYLEYEERLDSLTIMKFRVKEAEPTAVEYNEVVPFRFSLSQNYPNPFNPTTAISFNLIFGDNTLLEVFNSSGQKVATLVDGYLEAGLHHASWNASGLSAGVYFARLQSGNFAAVKKMTLLK